MSRRGHLHLWTALFVAFALLLGSHVLSWAHSDLPSSFSPDRPSQDEYQAPQPWLPPAHPMLPAISSALLTFALFVLMAFAMARGMWRWRRIAALILVLILGVFTFELAIHSVHHLSDPAKTAQCSVFFAAQYVTGALAHICDVYALVLAVAEPALSNVDAPTFTPAFRLDQPRAPPSFPA
jgi:ABC-type Fe3+ transport system permease subunit